MLLTQKGINGTTANSLPASQNSIVSGVSAAIAISLTVCFATTMRAQDASTTDYAALVKAHPGWVQIPGELICPWAQRSKWRATR